MNPRRKNAIVCSLKALGGSRTPSPGDRMMEFHVKAALRPALGIGSALFRTTGNLVLRDFSAVRSLSAKVREMGGRSGRDTGKLTAGNLNAMGLIDEILHIVLGLYRERSEPELLPRLSEAIRKEIGPRPYSKLLSVFTAMYPPQDVYNGSSSPEDWIEGTTALGAEGGKIPNRDLALEELLLLKLANENPGFSPFRFLFDDGIRAGSPETDSLGATTEYLKAFEAIEKACASLPQFGPEGQRSGLLELLRKPAVASPQSLQGQLAWIRENWGAEFSGIRVRILQGLDLIAEEERPRFPPGPGPIIPYSYVSTRHEYEMFTQDKEWMPSLVLLAKNALVWLHQLSADYDRPISRLDQIPDEELDRIAGTGINGLWLIGIWQRSPASEKIKKLCGNPEAAASAYSLFDYEIATEIGGWAALDSLRERCIWRGIRLAADMVPNHTGIDSEWIRTRPELFMSKPHCPFPSYTFNGPDLSEDANIGLWLEDHYYSKSDAAVVFKRLDRRSGEVRYIYHGNDGTGMGWNDTAQIDFLKQEARDAVRERILHVARHFSIIRFDAAMVLARQHVRRLWYPAPGTGGAIPSRAENSTLDEAFDKGMPQEFWREVVDECAVKAPETLLLAEAFWMMEGYFVRTLGMHRVYNSAFMNMLKDEKNSLYRLTIKNTQEFDREILKRFVNFMSNPDEETAIAQFGSGDKYFGVCTLMATMPGLPMFGHGQIEGLREKYGMEYRRSYRDEKPDQALIARHEKEIFPLVRRRRLFADVERFFLYDFTADSGTVDEDVFAYSNGRDSQNALVFYNNSWERTSGRILSSCSFAEKDSSGGKRLKNISLAHALGLEATPRDFLVARELRSGLMYVLRCADIATHGWRVDLEGYEAKVFIDFLPIHDLDGSYERLWRTLEGRGIPDLDDALETAARPDLYHALDATLDCLFDTGSALCRDLPDSAISEGILGCDIRAELYFSRLAQALAEEELPGPGIDAAMRSKDVLVRALSLLENLLPKRMRAEDSKEKSSSGLAHFQAIGKSTLGRGILLAYSFVLALSSMSGSPNAHDELRYLLEKFLVKKRLVQSISRLITECDKASLTAPLRPLDADALCALVFSFATRPKLVLAEKANKTPSARERASELLRWMSEDHLAREALGINLWEGIEYFNKERFEALAELWPAFALIEEALERNGAALPGPRARIALETSEIALKSLPGSAFRMDRLIEGIESVAG
jgi:hypothetical protein